MRKLIGIFIISILLVSCAMDSNSSINSSSDNKSLLHTVNSEADSQPQSASSQIMDSSSQQSFESDIQYIVARMSPDRKYSVLRSINTGYEKKYIIRNNETSETTEIGGIHYMADIQFISNDSFTFYENDYVIYTINGDIEYRLSDYFPVGETADGKNIIITNILPDDSNMVVLFFDRKEIVPLEESTHTGTSREPHYYKVAMLSSQGDIEKIINTGKNVESSKSRYVNVELELTDNLLTCYMPQKDEALFEMHVNLAAEQCEIIDYRT